MISNKVLCGALLLSAGVSSQAQTASSAASGTQTTPKTQEQLLLEQLTEKYNRLESEVEAIRKQLAERDAELKAAKAAASTAAPAPGIPAPAPADLVQGEGLKSQVALLDTKSTELAKAVELNRQETRTLESPTTIRFRGIELTPGGFVAGETVSRQRAIGGDVDTQFTGIPFAGQTAGQLSEFNASGRQSRLSLLAEGKARTATFRAYYEADFLSAGTTSNDNQSNSYTLRQRQVWAQAALQSGWTLTAGQMWSLATEYKQGLTNTAEAVPLTIDSQYNVGFTWERQYGFRVVKAMGRGFWIGASIEEPQTLNVGGHNLPTIVYQQAGNAGGLYNPTANYSYNYAPDLIAKGVYENKLGHFELFGIGRFFRDRVFPDAQLATPSALGAYTAKTQGGGIGANASVSLFSKKLDVSAHILAGNGIGRYSTATLADATAHPDGSLELLVGGSALGKLEWHPTRRFDLYAYYGGEYDKRAFYATGNFVTTAGPTFGQPILAGYGAPNQVVSGCYTEVLPVASANGGGNVPGSAASCTADNRNIQEGTFGYWYRFYQGEHGVFQQGIQYSYAERHTWLGIGNPLNGLGGSPTAIDNMWFTSFRYYLPK
jgi:hypothetical protein